MRRNGGRGQRFTWPPSSSHISCLLSFFKGNLFLDISKTHLKAIFTLWLRSRLQPPPFAPVVPPSHVAPDVSQSPFLGSQHSFDLILRAICNPLQDTETQSPAHHTSLSHSLSAFLSPCSLWTLPFLSSSLSAAPPTAQLPPGSVAPLWDCQHISYMQG